MVRLLLSLAVPLSCAAFSSVPCHRNCGIAASTTSLDAVSSGGRRELLQNALAAAVLVSPGIANAAGAYQSEAGYDDFSNGLSMPKYNVDNEGQLGLSAPGNKTGDPAKAAKAEAKAAADAAKRAAKKEADAAKRAAAREAEAAKLEAAAAKAAAKEEAKRRQLEKMSDAQRAKIEAYEARKAEAASKPKQASIGDNMRRMYGL